MSGGSITGNTATGNGGGIYVNAPLDGVTPGFTMTGGTISGNSSAAYGGGVCNASEMTITGGEIELDSNTHQPNGNLKPLYKKADSTDDYDESHVFAMVYTPSAAEIDILKTKGVGVQAHGTRILKIEFVAAPASK